MEERADAVIVGAGIVGIATAALLAGQGLSVTVIDRKGICEETSSGNAAALAFQEVLPLAHKGMWKKVPFWLTDPLGPLSIPPAYLPRLAPGFCASCGQVVQPGSAQPLLPSPA